MAQFKEAFEKMMEDEGGFVLHEVPGDTGGMTYAGISRNNWPNWPGWGLIDINPKQPDRAIRLLVEDFYQDNYWNRLRADSIAIQAVAESIFGFGINAGIRTAVRLAQSACGAIADGSIGPNTLAALNGTDSVAFMDRFAIAKMKRYAAICNSNRQQSKFLLGWLNRTLEEV